MTMYLPFGHGAMPWKSFKQTRIARSMIGSEFKIFDKVGEELK